MKYEVRSANTKYEVRSANTKYEVRSANNRYVFFSQELNNDTHMVPLDVSWRTCFYSS